jgi:hypothetical protein
MKRPTWRFNLALLLVLTSGIGYLVHYLIFHDKYYLFYYPIMDVAFLPLQVLLVTLVLDQVLKDRETRALMKKMNMVIGAFFSEVGNDLTRRFIQFDADPKRLENHLRIDRNWTQKNYADVLRNLRKMEFAIDSRRGDLKELKRFLADRRTFLLGLLENPNLLEHETFTELLWAVFHLTEELFHRPEPDPAILPDSDLDHISGDIRRAYGLILIEWLAYMRHLQSDYPYLFSLALRISPFDPRADAVVGSA